MEWYSYEMGRASADEIKAQVPAKSGEDIETRFVSMVRAYKADTASTVVDTRVTVSPATKQKQKKKAC